MKILCGPLDISFVWPSTNVEIMRDGRKNELLIAVLFIMISQLYFSLLLLLQIERKNFDGKKNFEIFSHIFPRFLRLSFLVFIFFYIKYVMKIICTHIFNG